MHAKEHDIVASNLLLSIRNLIYDLPDAQPLHRHCRFGEVRIGSLSQKERTLARERNLDQVD